MNLEKTYIDKDLIQEVARARHVPEEYCGFLFGHVGENQRSITRIMNVPNSSKDDKKYRFEIGAEDYLSAERWAENNDLQLLGVYHSHLNCPATPSETDRRGALPFFSYIIVSVKQGAFSEVRSWRLNDTYQFFEENLVIKSKTEIKWQLS